jgi:hypothetical protein
MLAAGLMLWAAGLLPAQKIDSPLSAMVKISGIRDGKLVEGTGFVVDLHNQTAHIVTSSQLIEGGEIFDVSFASASQSLSLAEVEVVDPASGLAILGAPFPAGVTALRLELNDRPEQGDALSLWGFPPEATAPRAIQGTLHGSVGTRLLIDKMIPEGFSGGPVLKAGKVVGVVTEVKMEGHLRRQRSGGSRGAPGMAGRA